MADTAKVAEFLQNVMLDEHDGQDEATPQFVSRPSHVVAHHDSMRSSASGQIVTSELAELPNTTSPVAFAGLDAKYNAFLGCLLTRPEWSRTALDVAARDHHVMLGGAVETINEWSLESFGDWLIDDAGPSILVRLDLLARGGNQPATKEFT